MGGEATGAILPAESSESDKELIKLLHDVEEVAIVGVDLDDDDNVLEVGDDNQFGWTLE